MEQTTPNYLLTHFQPETAPQSGIIAPPPVQFRQQTTSASALQIPIPLLSSELMM
jgi:hypothetical protein